MEKESLRIVYMGTPEFAVAPLESLLDNGYNVVGVVTVPDKPAGRGQRLGESAVKLFAKERGLNLLQPPLLRDPDFLASLEALKADLFIVVAFRMLPKVVWSMPRLGTFNLHGSLLPQYRGAAPINWAIINGESRSGVTTFMIDEEIDTGGILMQRETPIAPDETLGTLYDRLMHMGAKLVLETVEGLMEGTLKPHPQKAENPKPAPKLTKELSHINWEGNALELERLIRGLSPYPGTFTTLVKGNQPINVKIFGAKALEAAGAGSASKALPGSIISNGKSYLKVVCGEGVLEILEIQMAGKRRMKISEFLLGFRNPEEYIFK